MKKITYSTWMIFISALYFTGIVMMNFLAVKQIGINGVAIADCGTIISWFIFACMDIITELEGKKKAITYFTIASILNIIYAVVCAICIVIPGLDKGMSSSFKDVFSTNWRITLSSVIGAWLGNYVNAFIMCIMKTKSKDKDNSFGYMVRAIISSVLGQLVDNMLFYLLAFSPVGIPNTYELTWINILESVGITTAIELVIETCFVPLSAVIVKSLKKRKEYESNCI